MYESGVHDPEYVEVDGRVVCKHCGYPKLLGDIDEELSTIIERDEE